MHRCAPLACACNNAFPWQSCVCVCVCVSRMMMPHLNFNYASQTFGCFYYLHAVGVADSYFLLHVCACWGFAALCHATLCRGKELSGKSYFFFICRAAKRKIWTRRELDGFCVQVATKSACKGKLILFSKSSEICSYWRTNKFLNKN
jgi:hypothetical protein